MASLHHDEDVPSRSHSESSDDSDSQDSDDMRPKEGAGPRKTADGKVKKPANKDPNRVKRKKARRACENCQRAHLTCSEFRSSRSVFSATVGTKTLSNRNRRSTTMREMWRQEAM